MSSCTRISTSVRSSPPRALYFRVLPCGANPTDLCAVRAYKGFIQCAPGLVLLVLYEPQELCAVRAYKGFVLLCTVRAPRALRGASLQRLCASVCCTSPTSFVRCEPTKDLYGVHCMSLTSFVRCGPTKALYSVLAFALQALHRVLMCPCGRMSRW